MTVLSDRAAARSAEPGSNPSVVLVATLSAVGTAAIGLALVVAAVLVAWIGDPASTGGPDSAARTAALVWLLAHRAGIAVPGGHVGVTPLGITVILALLLYRAGRTLAQTATISSGRVAVLGTAALAVPYGLAAAGVSGYVGSARVHAALIQALLGALFLAAAAGGAGVARASGLGGELWRRLPVTARAAAPAALIAVCLLFAGGAALGATALGWHAHRAASITAAVASGPTDMAVLCLLQLMLLPNLAVWGMSFLLGPGFVVGAANHISPFAAGVGPLPALPLFAAMPTGGATSAALAGVLAIPVVVGAVCGELVRRRLPGGRRWHAAGAAVLMAMLAAAVCMGFAWVAGGPLGPGRLGVAGPVAWQVGLAAAGLLAPPAALVAAWRSGPAAR